MDNKNKNKNKNKRGDRVYFDGYEPGLGHRLLAGEYLGEHLASARVGGELLPLPSCVLVYASTGMYPAGAVVVVPLDQLRTSEGKRCN